MKLGENRKLDGPAEFPDHPGAVCFLAVSCLLVTGTHSAQKSVPHPSLKDFISTGKSLYLKAKSLPMRLHSQKLKAAAPPKLGNP